MEKGQSFCCAKCNFNPIGPWKRNSPFKILNNISVYLRIQYGVYQCEKEMISIKELKEEEIAVEKCVFQFLSY